MDDNILLPDPMTDIFAEMGCRDPLVVEQEEPDDDNDVANENDISAFQTPIHARLLSLFLSDKFADMTIRCGEREFKVHRAIVCSQSSFFDRAMSGNFLEARAEIVDLSEDDPDVVKCFLEFLYKGTYRDTLNSVLDQPDLRGMSLAEVQEELETPMGVIIDNASENGSDSDDSNFDPTYEDGYTCYYDDCACCCHKPGDINAEPEEEYILEDDHVTEAGDGNRPVDSLNGRRLTSFGVFDKRFGPENNAWARQVWEQHDLRLHLRLYVMADRFDVPALKLLARNRFYRDAESSWYRRDDFPKLVDELYETTPPNEYPMREIVCRLVGSGMRTEPELEEQFRWVMEKHEDFAEGVKYFRDLDMMDWT